MPDTKITALTAIGANPIIPSTFPIPMVDLTDTSMAASGTTKKVTVNQILGAGGTATLASATITGDLTVDTSTLKVDSANDRVGVGTASPASQFHIFNSGATTDTYLEIQNGTASTYIGTRGTTFGAMDAGDSYIFNSSGNDVVLMAANASGAIKFAAGGNTESMRLNSTGLGIGVTSALSKLTVAGSNLTTASWGISSIYSTDSMAIDKGGSITFGGAFTGTTVTYFAQISGRKENSTDSDVAGYLALSSRPTGGLTTDRMRVKSNGQIRFIPLAADPSGAEAGDVYYNSTSNKLKCYNGTTWNDLF